MKSNRGLQTWRVTYGDVYGNRPRRTPTLGITAGDILQHKRENVRQHYRDGGQFRRDKNGKLWVRVSEIATPFCILDEKHVSVLYPGTQTLQTDSDWTPSRSLLRGTS